MRLIQRLASPRFELDQLALLAFLSPWDTLVLTCLQDLSNRLLKQPEYRGYSELVALGFWLKATNLNRWRQQYQQKEVISKALGTVVHFTPANVDTMFVYSWVCSLLMGNHNIVRVSTRSSEVKTLLLQAIDQTLSNPEFEAISQRNGFISYPKESDVSARLSKQAQGRVIWGGDESVNQIRQLPCQPRSRDISFADRYSATLINGDVLTDEPAIEQLATLLWRDTEPYGQQACSSPRVIFWVGSKESQALLFERLNQFATASEQAVGIQNNHLVFRQLVQSTGKATRTLLADAISVIETQALNQQMLEWHTGDGMFLLIALPDIQSVANHATDKLQSLSYWGVANDALLKLIQQPSITGIDRVVPVGQALDFSPVWDGVDLFSQLSRQITVE